MAATSHDEKENADTVRNGDKKDDAGEAAGLAPMAVVAGKMVMDEHQLHGQGGEITDTKSEGEGTEEDETAGAGKAATHVVVATMVQALATFPPPPMLAAYSALASSAGGREPVQKRRHKKCEHGRQKSQCKDCKGVSTSSPFLFILLPLWCLACTVKESKACFRSSDPRAHMRRPRYLRAQLTEEAL